MYCAWQEAVGLFRVVDNLLLDQAPTPEQIKGHREFCAILISVGRQFEAGLGNADPDDLLPFGFCRTGISAQIAELEAMAVERKEIL